MLAVNTAVALAAAPETDAAVFDFDFQGGDVATFLAADPSCTVADVVGKEAEAESLGAALENTGEGVRVLAAPRTVEEAEEVEGRAAAAGRLLQTRCSERMCEVRDKSSSRMRPKRDGVEDEDETRTNGRIYHERSNV